MDLSEKQIYDESETDSEYSDDSQEDPNFDFVEETRLTFSNLALKKKTKTRVVKGTQRNEDELSDVDVVEMVMPMVLDEEDQKSYETIQKIIEGGLVEKLKVEQCKIYLRKHGLRLSGNKETLILRIKEHIDIFNGGGEKKYTASSFVLNCKGDACMGDIVMFEQNVYEEFNIASRSANGPPCGTRVVAGRIVKESYGAAKQQHTFTIEVLWSKGEKPLPPLHQLLIKGRNLYRLKTMRQKWEDESERQTMLSEKHARGGVARSNREARIQLKEMRKNHKPNRATRNGQPLHSVPGVNPNKLTNRNSERITHSYTGTCQPQNQINNHYDNNNFISKAHTLLPRQRQPLNSINNRNFKGLLGQQPVVLLGPSKSNWDVYAGQSYTNYDQRYFANSNYVKSPFKENRACGSNGVGYERKQACRYYAQGRCHFGDRCKYLHELASNK
ncbi:zinc finger CCCH domain-containing protein 62 [Phtheirospermum japonicum]|uniref:Zinc finger CCCH domain-containing protein 62 n=1 Tax=Phtheirospermum japonicum TaxID=374723 RepID=A0A830CWW6_9LAMI|nr:zinc finger CCCH domain-containing protein 62 [Phtheirospermum japonicum]